MNWQGVKNGLVNIGVPLLANAVVPGSGGLAATIAAKVLGVKSGKPEDLLQAISTATPEQIIQLKAEEHRHEETLTSIAAELDRDYLKDRQDARQRDIEIKRSGGTNSRANWMIAGDVVGLLACLGAMIYTTWLGVQGVMGGADTNPVIMALNGPLGMLTNQFAVGLRDAHQFEFGSSRGSKDKDQLAAIAGKG